MGISELFENIHGLIDIRNLKTIHSSPHLTGKDIKKASELLGVGTYNLFYNPDSILHPHFYYNDTFFFEFIDLKNLKKFDDPQLNEDYRFKMQQKHVKQMMDKKDYEGIINFADKKIRLYVFYHLYEKLSKEKQLEVFLEIYGANEYGFQHLTRDMIDTLFQCPLPDEYDPKHITHSTFTGDGKYRIYRGVSSKSTPLDKAYSWTLDRDIAEWFASRFNSKGRVHVANVDPKDIKAYINSRGEEEVIVYSEDIVYVNFYEMGE